MTEMPGKVVVSLITDQNDFQVEQAEDARRTAAELGLDIEVVFAEGNAVFQINQLFRFIHAPADRRPVALIVEPVSDAGMKRAAQNAVKAGIGWILLNRSAPHVAELNREFPKLPISSVRIDQHEVGRIQAEQYRRLLPSGGRVLYVEGPPETTVAKERREGMLGGIEGAGFDVTTIDADWTSAGAEKAFHAWWRFQSGGATRVGLVASQNDAMAMGIARATRDNPGGAKPGWEETLFTGVDGLPNSGRTWVDRGRLTATVIGPSNAGPALRLVSSFLTGGGPAPVELVQTPLSYPALDRLRPPR